MNPAWLFACTAGLIIAGAGCTGSGSSVTGGKFQAVKNGGYAVATAELGAVIIDGQRYLRWNLALDVSGAPTLRTVRVEDVTASTPNVYLVDSAPQVVQGRWSGAGGAIDSGSANAAWLFDGSRSTRLIRFTVIDLNGATTVLDQPVIFSAARKKEIIRAYSIGS